MHSSEEIFLLSIIGPNLIELPKTLDKNPILKTKKAITKPNMKIFIKFTLIDIF